MYYISFGIIYFHFIFSILYILLFSFLRVFELTNKTFDCCFILIFHFKILTQVSI